MTTLVTGAAGLIASRVVRNLLSRGEATIALDRVINSGRLNDLIDDSSLKIEEVDVSELDALDALCDRHAVNRIIHTAAALPPTSETEPYLGYKVNIGGTSNVFAAAHRHGVERVVYPTSIAVYGDQSDHGDAVLNETSPTKPFSLYGTAKLANEFLARAYTANYGLDCRGLRICTVFGHGRLTGRSAAASAMISSAAISEPYACLVTPEQTSAYIYVEDVAELMVQTAFAEGLSQEIYCVPTHRASLREIASTVSSVLPDAQISFMPDASGFEQINRMTGTQLASDLGYKIPPLETSIRHQIDTARLERQLQPLSAE